MSDNPWAATVYAVLIVLGAWWIASLVVALIVGPILRGRREWADMQDGAR